MEPWLWRWRDRWRWPGARAAPSKKPAGDAGEKTEQGQGNQAQGDNGATDGVDWASLIDIPGMDFAYSDRDKDASYDEAAATKIALAGQGATVSGEGAAVEGSTVIITAAGTYVVSGELTAGSLTVNAGDADKVQIVLSGASIRNEVGSALNIQQADQGVRDLGRQVRRTRWPTVQATRWRKGRTSPTPRCIPRLT